MERSRVAGLMELDGASMAAVSGGGLIPTTETSFWYDVAWWAAFSYRVVFDSAVDFSSGAAAGSYGYAKTGMY